LMAIRKNALPRGGGANRYYAPARYLCGLTETTGRGLTTIQDFRNFLAQDGCRLINEAVVRNRRWRWGLPIPKSPVAT